MIKPGKFFHHFAFIFPALLIFPALALFAVVDEETATPTTTVTQEEIEKIPPSKSLYESLFGHYVESIYVEPTLTTFFVKGDRGRFRQDWYTDDRTTGGIGRMEVKGTVNDVNYEYVGRQIIDYDYATRMKAWKEDGTYGVMEWTHFRKFWDGSQDKPWDPTTSRLNPSLFGDWPDAGLHTDRDNFLAEFGRPLSEDVKVIFRYELWLRKGRETLLKGEQVARTGLNTLRTLEMRRRVDGVSNTFTVLLPFTVNEIHNFEPAISFEAYRDSHFTDSARYTAAGALNQRRDYIDKPQFYDVKVQMKYDSFLTDNVYVHGGYFSNYLRNDSVRSEERLNAAGVRTNTYVNPDVDNWRVSNVVSLGTAIMDFLRRQGLDARLGFRGEHAYTNSHGILFAGGPNGERGSRTQLNEGWVGEAASLTYKGLKNTTAFVSLDMEQKVLRWQETYDARSHESITVFNSGVPFPHYKTNIIYVDFVPKVKLTHRFNSKVKGNVIYKWQERERHYNPLSDSDPSYYPGWLGNQERRVHDISSSIDVKLIQNWLTSLKYQYVTDNIEFEIGDQHQNLDRNRITASLSGPVRDRVFTYFYGMYEYYRVDTPTVGPGTNLWARGEEAYDFNGDVIVGGTNINYQVSKPMAVYLSYQLTDALGNDNNNTLNEVATGFRYNFNSTTAFEARYQVFNFQDKRGIDGGYDDDYYGQGMSFGFTKALG